MEFSCQNQEVACHNKKAVMDINDHCQIESQCKKKCDPRWKFADILDDLEGAICCKGSEKKAGKR